MDPYETLIDIIRSEIRRHNPPVLQLGTYKDKNLEIGGLKIPKKHCLVNSNLILDDAEYWTHQSGDKESALKKDDRCVLKSGDRVLAYQIKDEQYVIIAKVVDP